MTAAPISLTAASSTAAAGAWFVALGTGFDVAVAATDEYSEMTSFEAAAISLAGGLALYSSHMLDRRAPESIQSISCHFRAPSYAHGGQGGGGTHRTACCYRTPCRRRCPS